MKGERCKRRERKEGLWSFHLPFLFGSILTSGGSVHVFVSCGSEYGYARGSGFGALTLLFFLEAHLSPVAQCTCLLRVGASRLSLAGQGLKL